MEEQKSPTGFLFAAIRRSGYLAVSSRRASFFSPRRMLSPYTAAVSALDPGNLRHPHSQVKPRVNTPGLDGGQLHQRRIHFLSQLLLFQDFLRSRRLVEGIIFNAILTISANNMPCAGTSGVRRRHRPAAGPGSRSGLPQPHLQRTSVLYASGYRSRRLIFCIMYLRFDSQVDG